MKKLNYFTIGPKFEIIGYINQQGDKHIIYPCEFMITQKHYRIGKAIVENNKGVLRIQFDKSILALKNEEKSEIIKLMSRICYRLGNKQVPVLLSNAYLNKELEEQLLLDGFMKSTNYLICNVDQLISNGISKTILNDDVYEDVYQDLYTVPWNFVPQEFDVLDEFKKMAVLNEETKILDLGCGVGKNAIYLEQLDANVYGIDISSTAIKRCKELVTIPENFIVGSATNIPFEDCFFNFVLDIGCLHCMPTELVPDAIFQIHRVLKENGVLFSRIFKPKPQSWLDKQPFKADKFGLTEEKLINLFKELFDVKLWKQDNDMNYIMCKKG